MSDTKTQATTTQKCNTHEKHSHEHGPDCGHQTVKHGDHTDYVHDGHFHKVHGDHVDECTGPNK